MITMQNGKITQHLQRPEMKPGNVLCGAETIPWTPESPEDSLATPVCTKCHRIAMHQRAEELERAIAAPAGYVHPMQQDVALFHRAFEMPDRVLTPGPLPLDRIKLRVSLIHEEGVVELREALEKGNIVLTIDALIDTIYVSLGGLVEMGAQVVGLPRPSYFEPSMHAEGIDISVAHEIQSLLVLLEQALHAEDAVGSIGLFSSIASTAYHALIDGGFDPKPFFDEVQRANMSKLGADGKPVKSRGMELDGYPEGKVLKGAGYVAPNLSYVYREMFASTN